jgi:MFS family permease
MIAGPLSETVGRNPVYLGSLVTYMLFIMGAGLSQSIEAQLICRFFAGFFGESPLSTVGGSIADIWDPLHRLVAFPLFACMSEPDTAESLQQNSLLTLFHSFGSFWTGPWPRDWRVHRRIVAGLVALDRMDHHRPVRNLAGLVGPVPT